MPRHKELDPMNAPRSLRAVVTAGMLALSLAVPVLADEEAHEVEGRFSMTSEAGGAVWAFRPGGVVMLTGPGDIVSSGTWSAGPETRDFDAVIEYEIAGQELAVQGQVSPDAQGIAVYVAASEATKPDDADPWPEDSRLIGERLGMEPEATTMPELVDCERPDRVDGEVDWDRCAIEPAAEG
jgi:hypothetical protein